MKQKSSRVLTEKTENGSFGNAQAQERRRILPEGVNRKRFGEIEQRLTRGARMSGLKRLAGARRRRWTPASNHGELGETEGTKSFSVFFRVGGWWTRPTGSTTSTATLSPADGGSGEVGELRWRAAKYELRRGSERVMQGEATGKRMGAAEHTRGRIGLDPVADRGGRSRGRRPPRGSSSGWACSRGSVGLVGARVEARGPYL